MVEFCSVLERALNYMHTGNTAVIATTVMNPLWIGRAILKDGFPCLNQNIVQIIDSKYVDIDPKRWPSNYKSNTPHSSSRRSQTLTYGDQHFNVSPVSTSNRPKSTPGTMLLTRPVFQTFFSHLCMGVILARPPIQFLENEDEHWRIAKSIAFNVLTIFVQDCKDFVSKFVHKSISRQVAAPFPLRIHGKIRQEALKLWLWDDNPLSWGILRNGAAATTYQQLSTLLTEDPNAPDSGLIKSQERWTYTCLAQDLVENGVNGHAPVLKAGYFPTALSLAYSEIQKLSSDPAYSSQFAITALASMLQKAQIHFVPWHKPAHPQGRASHIAQPDHWLFLDHSSSHSPHANTATFDNPSPRAKFARMATSDAAEDPSAPWSVPDAIQDMGSLREKAVLPADWSLGNASLNSVKGGTDGEYVRNTYEYVERTYNGKKWQHHLGLVLAILISTILPRVFADDKEKQKAANLNSGPELTKEIRRLSWVKTTSRHRKGVTAKGPYITMLSTAIIAILDENSPLRIHMRAENMLGIPWTHKHGKLSLFNTSTWLGY